jgi:murein DD-endopeptidase MepM/ murein hydrolase activator NlpD
MSPNAHPRQLPTLPLITTLFSVLLLAALAVAPLDAAKAPVKKTYFTIILGLESPHGWQADCLRFTASEMCTLGGNCGSWARTEAAGPETAITFALSFEESGVPVEIDGQARIDDRGKSSSLAGAARARIGGRSSNFGLTGRATKKSKCLKLLRDWDSKNPPPQPAQNASCLHRATFGSPGESPYRLPFQVGKTYRLGQTYCAAGDTHEGQLAYDLMLPIGAPVLAARGGTVREIRNDDAGVHNHIYIEHDDGTTAFYAHLQLNSVLVSVDQAVEAGERIASSGSSGSDVPVLHFGVYRGYPPTEGDDLPVNFRNADGPLDPLGGLIQDVFYRALPLE